jgi:hypothetical protein
LRSLLLPGFDVEEIRHGGRWLVLGCGDESKAETRVASSRLRVFTFRTTTALATNHSITNSADEIYVGYILHFSVYAR